MQGSRRSARSHLLCGAAMFAVISLAGVAKAEDAVEFNIPPQSLETALNSFGVQSRHTVMFKPELAAGKVSAGVANASDPELALNELLAGTGLAWRKQGDLFLIVQQGEGGSGPQSASAGNAVEALIVTAQKREENIQDVPIAMSAFTQESLTTHQIAGGPDLMTQIPNFTFTKTNFSSYSIQIRGIGTQAISATVDPAVVVAFNNTPFIHSRFFEQEFYDLARVEVLRGPQGTLYGRNATAGVVNLLTARPVHRYEAKLSVDAANYNSTRLEGMINIPLIEDKVALRIAGAWTKRDGYVTNQLSGAQIDGRDLWSTRVTLRIEPNEFVRANLTYEHFEEDDDRLRSGKQLCTRSPSPTEFDGVPITGTDGGVFSTITYTSQGCMMGSLYSDEAFQTPNGFALPYYGPLKNVGLPIDSSIDPYLSTVQSRDLRVIESSIEPIYKAKNDTIHLALEIDLTPGLTLTSETGYNDDELFSFQDYNRFNTTSGVFDPDGGVGGVTPVELGVLSPEGVFCDPQLGCADRLVAADVSTARANQFSQEFRLSSDFDGPLNFHVGANFLRMDTVNKYYVFVNTLTMFSALWGANQGAGTGILTPWDPGVTDNAHCHANLNTVDPNDPDIFEGFCTYIDPNPIGALNDFGRNYFLSKNPFRLISYAAFGEVQYNITPTLKLTGGLRFTVDKKHAPIVPTWVLAGGYGLPVKTIVEQEWREPTGRAVIDWQPDLSFTDETLLYASYAHGYKAGGTNPPLPGALPVANAYGVPGTVSLLEALQPPEFEPEFVDAFEVGTKNVLLDGRLTFNANAFYYDYKGYQISQISNRSALNLNYDAEVWGAELEVDWRPLENLKFGFKGGYEKTKVGDGQSAVDMIDRTAGIDGWAVIKPFPTNPNNCIFPEWLLGRYFPDPFSQLCTVAYLQGLDPLTGLPYVPNPTVRAGGGAPPTGYPGFDPTTVPSPFGFPKDLGGNELPNAPDFTATVTIDYTIPLPNDWLLTLHTDLYRQSQAWTRIFNEDPYDKLEPYTNINVAAIFTNEDAGWHIMAYIKNLQDSDSITGAFLNSDDSGLTTNVFLTEPRLYGLRVTKAFAGGPWWGEGGERATGPYPFEVEIGAGALRMEAENEVFLPDFVDDFSDAIRPVFAQGQDARLDWGDTRHVRVNYRPRGGPWVVSATARFGRTNGTDTAENSEDVPGGCIVPPAYAALCDVPAYADTFLSDGAFNYGRGSSVSREDHAVVDFTVGKDVGLGALEGGLKSRLSAGLRFARFNSHTDVTLLGKPDYYVPPLGMLFCPSVPEYCATVTEVDGTLESRRSFEGVGPVVSWEASADLFGNQDAGVVALDWSLGGGVLFGKQQTSVEGEMSANYYRFYLPSYTVTLNKGDPITPPSYVTPISRRGDEEVTVPTVGVSLGLSYRLDRLHVSTGYSWDRYFDVIDGGIDERKAFDRDIHGPYVRFRYSFGG